MCLCFDDSFKSELHNLTKARLNICAIYQIVLLSRWWGRKSHLMIVPLKSNTPLNWISVVKSELWAVTIKILLSFFLFIFRFHVSCLPYFHTLKSTASVISDIAPKYTFSFGNDFGVIIWIKWSIIYQVPI